jgi:hypothetical protein
MDSNRGGALSFRALKGDGSFWRHLDAVFSILYQLDDRPVTFRGQDLVVRDDPRSRRWMLLRAMRDDKERIRYFPEQHGSLF